jgi:hypothetical protein
MGKAKRRQTTANAPKPLPDQQGAALVDIYIIRLRDGPGLFIAAVAGDERAAYTIEAIDIFLNDVGRRCLCCDRRFSVANRPKAFVVGFVEPGVQNGHLIEATEGSVLVMGLCVEHYRNDDAELVQIALEGFRQLVPSTRAVPVCAVSTQNGRA